jgi:choline dehydrogenase
MYDYVVVGGGSAGCVVAGQLASAGKSVLLLEAGPSADEHPETLRADGYKDAFINDSIFWERFSVPQRYCGKQRVFLGTGSVLGGSGAVNGMVYTRGAREDYDEWPEGWRWDDVVPDFEKLEDKLRIHQREPTRWTEACIEAAEACGFKRSDNLNNGRLSNAIGYEWMTYDGSERRSSYVAFIRDAGARDNLEIHTGARVERITFDDQRRASSVIYQHEGVRKTAEIGAEVVLCAGALETPKLLMHSGIGPGAALQEVGIDVVADVRGVGSNLHDHPNVPVFFRCKADVDCYYPQLYSFYRTHPNAALAPKQSDTCYVFWPAPSAMKEATQRMLPAQVLPESLYDGPAKHLIRGGIELAFKSKTVRDMVDHLFAIVIILGKPQSRGSIRLRSNDPTAPADIDPCYFAHTHDMETMVRGIRMARKLGKSPALEAIGSSELMPGGFIKSDEALARWIGKNAITTYHFAGTCRMGTDDASVVDSELRLRGVSGVRVADASVVPTTPVSAMNAPSMLVGMRAARFMLA